MKNTEEWDGYYDLLSRHQQFMCCFGTSSLIMALFFFFSSTAIAGGWQGSCKVIMDICCTSRNKSHNNEFLFWHGNVFMDTMIVGSDGAWICECHQCFIGPDSVILIPNYEMDFCRLVHSSPSQSGCSFVVVCCYYSRFISTCIWPGVQTNLPSL